MRIRCPTPRSKIRMQTMTSHSDIDERIRAQAFEWWTRLHSGKATKADAHAFAQWRGQSPAHRQAWRELSTGIRRADPALQEAAQRFPQWGELSNLRPASQPMMKRRALLGGALAASAAGLLAWRPPLGLWPSVTEFAADFRTGIGEQREIEIAHAVAVQMNTQTRINRYDMGQGTGIELLTGEAEIRVSDAATAALTVQAGAGRMRAQLAQFNVRYTGPQVTVTCLQGQVQVQAVQDVTLQAGQQTVYDQQRIQTVRQADLTQVMAWRHGYLVFVDAPLSEVVEEINRYRQGKILLRGEALAARPVRMRLAIRDMDLALGMLRSIPDVKIQELAGGIALLRQA